MTLSPLSAAPLRRPGLTEGERQRVRELEERDAEVRVHEEAHFREGGRWVRGGIHYDYEIGPDGRQYAVGGHVAIDVEDVSGDPAATIAKMRQVRRSALAPGDPSDQDLRVAALADSREQKAQAELLERDARAGRPLTVLEG